MTADHPIKSPRKLIEVALPLDAINEAAAKEKSIRHGHPSTLHLWWARRPLAAARAVIFAQMVNDPGFQQGQGFRYGMNKKDAAKERERLFKIITDLVLWENTANDEVLERARAEIRRSWREVCELNKDHPRATDLFNPDKLPAFHDPFAGGGALPLEAQRLGLESNASDLNPVAVTINKAMIEIPPKFAGRPPVGPDPEGRQQGRIVARVWPGALGLAEDVRRYAAWMREEAQRRIGHLYPPVHITEEMVRDRPDLKPYVGEKLTVIAWLWARTVRSPNPAFGNVEVPLASTFVLSSREGKESYVQPVIEGKSYRFTVKTGRPPKEAEGGTAAGKRAAFTCLMSGVPIGYDHIRSEGKSGRMGQRLMAIVAEGARGRVYIEPVASHADIAAKAKTSWKPETLLPDNPRDFKTPNYGMMSYGDLFTNRQLAALSVFSDLVSEAVEQCRSDAIRAGLPDDSAGLDIGGTGALAYAQAVGVYLAFCVDKCTITNTSLATWQQDPDRLTQAFSRQSIAMTWDFAEANPLSSAGGGFINTPQAIYEVLENLPRNCPRGSASQEEAQKINVHGRVISTDPPYYDNIGYADLSDYFYIWMRRALGKHDKQLYATVTVPKGQELVATPYRHGGKENAERFFMDGMCQVMRRLSEQGHPAFPQTIYFAFKQSVTDVNELLTSNTGWDTFLESVVRSGFVIDGTWPMRTELTTSLKKRNNALASSVVLVCRRRAVDASVISRREFLRELNAALPDALDEMTRGGVNSPVAPVDLSQAIIGPGMAIFSKYSAVLEADGTPMSVKTALQLINRFLAEDDFDADTQFCLHWFDQFGWDEGKFGEADVLARSKGTSVDGVKAAGVASAGGGVVRLLKPSDYPADWDPKTDARLPVWESLHHLIRIFRAQGETTAGRTLAAIVSRQGASGQAEVIRQLAYRLYTVCERSGRAEDARAYNELIASWSPIESASAAQVEADAPKQLNLFDAN